MTAPRIYLPIVVTPDEDITSVDEFFACRGLSARMRVEHCLSRQADHGVVVRLNHAGQPDRRAGKSRKARKRIDNGMCRDCEQGRAIAERAG